MPRRRPAHMRAAAVVSVAFGAPVLGLAFATPALATGEYPLGVDDTYMIPRNGILVVPAPGLLANDTDAEGEPLTAHPFGSQPFFGSFRLRQDGSFVYRPRRGREGYDSFVYMPFDGTNYGNPTYVRIRVNGKPYAAPDSYGMLRADGVLNVPAPGVLVNDLDRGGDIIVPKLRRGPAHGRVRLGADGSVFYRPDRRYVGEDSFEYRVTDGERASDPVTVHLRVVRSNSAPTPGADTYAFDEDSSLYIEAPGLLANDTDADGDTLQVVIADDGSGLPDLTLYPDGSFEYLPEPDRDDDISFTYRVTDGLTTSAPILVYLDIRAVNDAPYAEDDQYKMLAGDTLIVPAPGVLSNDYDNIEYDGVHAVGPVNPPTSGDLVLNTDGSFTYTPWPGFSGGDSFTYNAADANIGGLGTVSIYVYDLGEEGAPARGAGGRVTAPRPAAQPAAGQATAAASRR